MPQIKKYEELAFTDDFMFTKVLSTNLDLTKELLELILGWRIGEVRLPQPQKSIAIARGAKGVRFDVYTCDDDGRQYDIEMQVRPEADLPRRSRYYHSILDLNSLEKGRPYRELADSCVIFICRDGSGVRALSSYRMRCDEAPEETLGDGAYTILLNAQKRESGPKGLREFLDYVREGTLPEEKESFVNRLHAKVLQARARMEWRHEYMFYSLHDEDVREEGRALGLEEGLTLGREQGRAQGQAIGREEGDARTVSLIRILLAKDARDDLDRALNDREYRWKLFAHYNL